MAQMGREAAPLEPPGDAPGYGVQQPGEIGAGGG